MTRILTILFAIITLTAFPALADKNTGIVWDETTHDFGTIHASAGKVKATYTFTNNSSSPVAIVTMTNGGCGCTVPSYPKKPVAPGASATVTVTFDPARFQGEFKRQVTVTIQAGDRKVKTRLKFNGHIIPD